MQEAFSHTISKRKPKKAEALYQRPSNMWEEIYLGDIRYYFLNDVGGALDAWRSAFEKVD